MMEKQGVIDDANTPREDKPRDAAGDQKTAGQRQVDESKLSEHTTQRLADAAAKR